jgi:hypothetical protein
MMALLREIEKKEPQNPKIHSEINGSYQTFEIPGDRKYIQIDTYGSKNRKFPGKISQSLQFDEKSAREFFEILRKEFDFK